MKKRDFRSLSSQAQDEIKRAAMKMLKAKKTQQEVSDFFSVRQQTVSIWWNHYQREGLKGLRTKRRGRRPGEKRNLTSQVEKEVMTLIIDRCPEQFKLPFVLWTREAVQQLVKKRYGISMPIRTVGEYLKRWGFTPKKPVKRAYEQQPEEVRKWLDSSYPEIVKQARVEKAEIHWCDETGISNESNVCKGYSPVGKKPVMRTSGKRFSVSMISTITNQGQLRYMIYKGGLRVKKFIEFLRRLIKSAGRKVFVILDNLRVHHAIKVKEWVEEHHDEVALFFLPPYSPEYNPDEYVNQDVKSALMRKPRPTSEDKLNNNLSSYMKSLQRKTKKVKKYFKHEKVKYAA